MPILFCARFQLSASVAADALAANLQQGLLAQILLHGPRQAQDNRAKASESFEAVEALACRTAEPLTAPSTRGDSNARSVEHLPTNRLRNR